MLLRPGIAAAVLAVGLTVGGVAYAANQSVTAESGPNRFSPVEVTVTQGEMVTFSNGSGTHNVHFDDDSVDFPATATGGSWTFSHTFNEVGDVRYYCEIHGDAGGVGMSGIVHVVAAPPTPPGQGPPPGNSPGGGGPGPGPGNPGPALPLLKVTLKASDATPLAGRKVRLFGQVRPARDGHKLQIQKRTRSGKWVTIATTRLRDAGAGKSIYSVRLRISADGVLRARVAGDDERATGVSKGRKLDVHRAA